MHISDLHSSHSLWQPCGEAINRCGGDAFFPKIPDSQPEDFAHELKFCRSDPVVCRNVDASPSRNRRCVLQWADSRLVSVVCTFCGGIDTTHTGSRQSLSRPLVRLAHRILGNKPKSFLIFDVLTKRLGERPVLCSSSRFCFDVALTHAKLHIIGKISGRLLAERTRCANSMSAASLEKRAC